MLAKKAMSVIKQWLQRVFNWDNFYEFLQMEIKVYVYLLFIFCLFRGLFVAWMHDYISAGVTGQDIGIALFYGLRISLRSAIILTEFSAVFGGIFYLLAPLFMPRFKKYIVMVYTVVLTLLFCGRIPYYEQFHSNYNQLIFNTFNDDMYALLISLIEEFHLPFRILIALGLAAGLFCLFVALLQWRSVQLPVFSSRVVNYGVRGCFLILLYYGTLCSGFAGSTSYVGNIDWENSAVTKDKLLNEAILDDVHALYRAHEMNGRLMSSAGLDFPLEQIKLYAERLTGKKLLTNQLDLYLQKSAQGVAEKPRHVFLIMSESYANWPFLEKYADLHLADGMKQVINRQDSVYADTFLPNGQSTISGVMGVVTGFADANLYLNMMPEAYQEPYSTALAPQLQRLGYQTNFWYAGASSWEKIREFSLAQGFQRFYGKGDYQDASGNVWGCDDEVLYREVLAGLDKDRPSFNLVLNVSNHSPYTVDLDQAGFDREGLRAVLPEQVRNDEELITKLGHAWYADKMLAEFIASARVKYPDSLFIVVGDHADRVNIDKTPSLYERCGIPLIVTGKGVSKQSFPQGSVGSHIDIVPTLIELIAPQDFAYYSVGKSLTRGNYLGVNYGLWVSDGYIGKADSAFNPQAINDARQPPDAENLREYVDAIRCISWWRIKSSELPDVPVD